MQQYEDLIRTLEENGGGGVSLDPFAGIKELIPLLVTWTLIVGTIIAAVWIFSMISRYRSERAMIHMQKDMKAIRELLERQSKPPVVQLANNPPVVTSDESGEAA